MKGLTVSATKPTAAVANPGAPIQPNVKLQCAYELPHASQVLIKAIDLFVADYGGNAASAFDTFAKLGECAKPDRDPSRCKEPIDPAFSEYTRTADEMAAITVLQPVGSENAFGATPTTRMAGITVTVRNGVYVCSTAGLTDPASESPAALDELGHRIRSAVEVLCGR